ncbi:MAG: hypothetical protein K2H63_04660 [Paramuribaculum sp.]|nr:hypothetical protein [Paramuribaculum sp.]
MIDISLISTAFNLKGITSKCFVHRVECILVGLTFVKVSGRDYKIFLTIYPLWRSNLKSCIDVPLLLQPLVDDNGLDIYLSEGINIIDRCNTQFQLLNGCNTAADFVRILYEIIATDKSIQTNFVLQMKIYELIYGIALYLNNIDISQDVYIQISNQISGWDKKIFNYWYGDKDTTLSKLLEFESNKRRIVKNVVLNSSDPKVKKLPTYKFIEHHETDR